MIAACIAGAYVLIEQSKETQTYFISKTDLPSGTPLSSNLLDEVELSLFASGEIYLDPGISLDQNFLVRPISKGELIPLSAVSTQLLDDFANLVITPTVPLSSKLTPGSSVSIWSSPRIDYQSFGEPVLLALEVEVIAITEAQSNFSGDLASVEVRVPADSVSSLLYSISNGDALALIASAETLGD